MNFKIICLTTLAFVVSGLIGDAHAIWSRRSSFSSSGSGKKTTTIETKITIGTTKMNKRDADADDVDSMRQRLSDGDIITMTKIRDIVNELHDGKGFTAEQVTKFLQNYLEIEVLEGDMYKDSALNKRSVTNEELRELEKEIANMREY